MKGNGEQSLKGKGGLNQSGVQQAGDKNESEAKIAQNYYINQINISNLKNSLKKQLNENSMAKSSQVPSTKGERRQDSATKQNKTRTSSKQKPRLRTSSKQQKETITDKFSFIGKPASLKPQESFQGTSNKKLSSLLLTNSECKFLFNLKLRESEDQGHHKAALCLTEQLPNRTR